MKKTFFVETVLIFLIVVSQTIFVKPFNIEAASNYLQVPARTCQLIYSDNNNDVYLYSEGRTNLFLTQAGSVSGTFIMQLLGIDDNNYGQGLGSCPTTYTSGTHYNYFGNLVVYSSIGMIYSSNLVSNNVPIFNAVDEEIRNSITQGGSKFSYFVPFLYPELLDGITVTKYDANTDYNSWTNSNPYIMRADADFYGMSVYNNNNNMYNYYFSTVPFNLTISRGNTTLALTDRSFSFNGVQYYGYSHQNWSYSTSYNYANTTYKDSLDPGSAYLVMPYLINNGSLLPDEDTLFGDIEIGFYTNYAGSGNYENNYDLWKNNVDVIEWDLLSSKGIELNTFSNIEIRAVPGQFSDLNRATLLTKIFSDFVIDWLNPYSLGIYDPNLQNVSFRWGDIGYNLTALLGQSWDIFAYVAEDIWIKNGWIYQVRLVDKESDEPITEWKTIFNTTSSSGNDGLNNITDLTPELINELQNLNTINNTTNNYYYNNTVINMSDGTVDGSKPWYVWLLERITSLIEHIVDAIAGIGSSIIDGIFNLINSVGVNILDTFSNLWNGFINTFNNIGFNDDNPDYDISLPEDTSEAIDIIPAFLRGMNSAGLLWMIFIPLVFSIIKIIT